MELTILTKTTGEKATFEMPFASKINSDDDILSVNNIDVTLYTGSGAATAGASAILDGSVFARYSGGVDGSTYLVKVSVTTTSGDTLEMYGLLEVVDPSAPA